jgi:SAM-dependent methyltransferase
MRSGPSWIMAAEPEESFGSSRKSSITMYESGESTDTVPLFVGAVAIWISQHSCRASNRPELEDKSVDLIFASSVFTHLSPETEDRALRELLRLIRPAGSLLLTFRGKNYESRLSAKQLEILHRKGVLVRNPRADGENECDAYHTRDYIREKFGSLFDRMVHIESPVEFRVRDQAGYTDPGQDVWLFTRRLSG